MSEDKFSRYASVYDPLKVGCIDGSGNIPHDNGIVRATSAVYRPNPLLTNNPKLTLFVGRLDKDVTEEDLKEVSSFYFLYVIYIICLSYYYSCLVNMGNWKASLLFGTLWLVSQKSMDLWNSKTHMTWKQPNKKNIILHLREESFLLTINTSTTSLDGFLEGWVNHFT